jgi:hypothetical protein
MRNAYKMLVPNLKGRDHLGDLGIGGRIILKWTLRKQGVRVWTGLNWLSDRFWLQTLLNMVMNT